MKGTQKKNCPANGKFFVNSFIENHAFCKLFETIVVMYYILNSFQRTEINGSLIVEYLKNPN
jgi:hypothetical protein